MATLVELSAFSSAFIAQHLSVAPRTSEHPEDRLVVGDGMRSIFVLDVDEGSGEIFGDQRDMATHCVLGMEGVRDGGAGVVVSDVSEPKTELIPGPLESPYLPLQAGDRNGCFVRAARGRGAIPSWLARTAYIRTGRHQPGSPLRDCRW